MNDRELFLAERKTSVGGSDVADMLDLAPFGCERKLYYAKSGVPEDFPIDPETNHHVRRGMEMEAIAIREFCKQHDYVDETGVSPPQGIHPEYPLVAAHADRIVRKRGGVTRVVCETKVPGARMFDTIKNEGTYPESWNAQIRWTMLAYRLRLGVLNVFNPIEMVSVAFEVQADPIMEEQLIEVAESFWKRMEIVVDLQMNDCIFESNTFPKKPDDYKGCVQCPFRKTCKGWGARGPEGAAVTDDFEDVAARAFVLDDQLEPTIQRLIEAREKSKYWEKEKKELEAFLEWKMDGRNVVTTAGFRAYFQGGIRNMKYQPAKEAHQQKTRSLKTLAPGEIPK